jgi:hypothetical protein
MTPEDLLRLINNLPSPFFTACQALEVLHAIKHHPDQSRTTQDYRRYHVMCTRVIDKWNLTGQHDIGYCYHGMNRDDGFDDVLGGKPTPRDIFSWFATTDRQTFGREGLADNDEFGAQVRNCLMGLMEGPARPALGRAQDPVVIA